jgi:hypothetical protein
MAFPSNKEIESPLLNEIALAGGEVSIRGREIYAKVARYFPGLTDEDLAMPHCPSCNAWENRVQWARLKLVQKGEILDWRAAGKQGLWRITEKGLARVNREAVSPPPTSLEVTEEETDEHRKVHAEVQKQLEEIGAILGKYSRREYRQDIYRYDVVWKDSERLPRATHAFEVQHRGNVVEALGKLKHAYDIWHSYLFVVITGERDRARIEQLLRPYFTGMFHEIGGYVKILTAEDVGELYDALSKHSDTMRRFIGR